jgi:hypothetical protein
MFLPSFASAGEIYGSIKEGKKSVGKGVTVEIIAASGRRYVTKTDKYSSYRLYVRERGKCILKVYYNGQSPQIQVHSYKGPVRYDLVLEKRKGKYILRRK